MARADYAAILDRHCGKGETLAGGIVRPHLERCDGGVCSGSAYVAAAMMHENRWPALYGGYLFDLADRAARLSAESAAGAGCDVRPLALEMHFLRAIRRADVPEPDGLRVAWRVRIESARPGTLTATIEIGATAAPYAYAFATLRSARESALPDSRCHSTVDPDGSPREVREAPADERNGAAPASIVLPAHDAGWTPGLIRGRCLEKPGSFAAIADTLLAKAMATVRGDDCPDGVDEHFLVRSLSYYWLAPVDDGLATFEARVVQRGKRMALAVGELSLDGTTVGRAAGTVVIRQVAR